MESSTDKAWAQKYLIDPLNAPEPSQIHAQDIRNSQLEFVRQKRLSQASNSNSNSNSSLTPPSSASPTTSSFHHSNPFSSQHSESQHPQNPFDFYSVEDNLMYSRSSVEGQEGNQAQRHRHSQSQNLPQRSASTRTSGQSRNHQRNHSLPQRFPGDMSNRPLDTIKREHKTADRHPHNRPHRRHRSSISQTDIIDQLDTIGGTYHHGGPYDATLASRNLNDKYSPLAAVHDSNMEAIRATPKEYIQDSLQKHVPLQGTAIIPSGGYDLSGNVMSYNQGSDLMREPDAPGGAYKRWDGIPYHPDDLKGKGEPSYTIERDSKKMKGRQHLHPDSIEMTAPRRHRSYSNNAAESSSLRVPGQTEAGSSGLHRSNTTGKNNKLSEGLKKRFGSMRRKKDAPTQSVH